MNNCYMRKNETVADYHFDYEDVFAPDVDRVGALVDQILVLLAALPTVFLRLISKPAVRRVLRYVGVAVCFFCFLGLLGGIEQGLITAGAGVVAGLLLIFLEIFCLR